MNHKPWAYVTAAWKVQTETEQKDLQRDIAGNYMRQGYTPICPLLLGCRNSIDMTSADEFKDYSGYARGYAEAVQAPCGLRDSGG